jgi:hypothetical protein
MEGELKISPGDYVAGGYSFKAVGTQPNDRIYVINAHVDVPVSCSAYGSNVGIITIPLVDSSQLIPGGDNSQYPTSNDASYYSYHGSVQAPDLCSGGYMYVNPQNGHSVDFSANVYDDQPGVTIGMQFHYRDPAAIGYSNTDCSNPSQNPEPGDYSKCNASESSTVNVTCYDPAEPWPASAGVLPIFGVTPEMLATLGRRLRSRRSKKQVKSLLVFNFSVSSVDQTALTQPPSVLVWVSSWDTMLPVQI